MAKVTSESIDPPPSAPALETELTVHMVRHFLLSVGYFVFFACVAVRVSDHVTTKNLSPLMKGLNEAASEEEVAAFLSETYPDSDQEIEFESFLQVHASHRFSELLNCNAVRNGAVFSINLFCWD
jgi:hypothetical protein